MVCVLVLLVRLCVVESVWTPRQTTITVGHVKVYVLLGRDVMLGNVNACLG